MIKDYQNKSGNCGIWLIKCLTYSWNLVFHPFQLMIQQCQVKIRMGSLIIVIQVNKTLDFTERGLTSISNPIHMTNYRVFHKDPIALFYHTWSQDRNPSNFKNTFICYYTELSFEVQWSPLESLQVLFYEAKVPFSERCITILKMPTCC